MSDQLITALASLAVILGLCCLAWAASFLVRDTRKRRMKVATVTRSTPPPTVKYCAHCNVHVIDPPGERYEWCPRCLSNWASVADAVPTPDDEPPTLPGAA